MPLFGRRDSWPHCSAQPDEAILSEVPPILRRIPSFTMTAVPSDSPTLEATRRFTSGRRLIMVTVGVSPTAAIAKIAMRNMESVILRNPMFLRRGRGLRGLGQTLRQADEDAGTEGVSVIQSAHCHFMRLANVTVATIGLDLAGEDAVYETWGPLALMSSTIEAQLDHLAALANDEYAWVASDVTRAASLKPDDFDKAVEQADRIVMSVHMKTLGKPQEVPAQAERWQHGASMSDALRQAFLLRLASDYCATQASQQERQRANARGWDEKQFAAELSAALASYWSRFGLDRTVLLGVAINMVRDKFGPALLYTGLASLGIRDELSDDEFKQRFT